MKGFEKIGNRIWYMHANHETDRPILAYIKGENRSLLIDAGNSPDHAASFQEELRLQGLEMPELLAYTHWHWDHTFAGGAWNCISVAHDLTAQAIGKMMNFDLHDPLLKDLISNGMASDETIEHLQAEYGDNRDIRLKKPTLTFEGGLTIDLGGVTCEITHVGGDHAEDSCLVYIKEEKTLFIGDALGPAMYGGPRYYNAKNFLNLVEKVLAYDADVFVESHDQHLSRQAYEADLEDWIKLARIVVEYGNQKAKVMDEFAKYLKLESLTDYWLKAVDWFIEGEKRNQVNGQEVQK